VARVFLSHKSEDNDLAAQVAARIRTNGLQVYLDSIDHHLKSNGPDLAEYIQARLSECTQLLAIVSHHTRSSWWVPWEIGVATEKRRFLASFVSSNANIPEYLLKWPYLRTLQDVDKYCATSKDSERQLNESARRGSPYVHAQSTAFKKFHSNLKHRLHQM